MNHMSNLLQGKKTVKSFSREITDGTIDSMPKRIDEIIKNKGIRTKY